jgi:hypothetical protein
MAILVGLYNKITSAGGKLKVAAIQRRTYGSFKAAHVHKLLEIEEAAVIGKWRSASVIPASGESARNSPCDRG